MQAAKNTYDTGQQQRQYYSASAMKPAHRAAQSSASNHPLGGQRRTITTHNAFDSNLQQIKSRHISSSSNAHATKPSLFSKSQFQSNHQDQRKSEGQYFQVSKSQKYLIQTTSKKQLYLGDSNDKYQTSPQKQASGVQTQFNKYVLPNIKQQSSKNS